MMMSSIKVILPGKCRNDVFKALARFKQQTEISVGCIGCHIRWDVEKPNTLIYSEEWQTREDLKRHVRSSNYRLVLEIIELSVQEPEIKFFTVSKIEGLEVVKNARISA